MLELKKLLVTTVVVGVIFSVTPNPVYALSCMYPDIAYSYKYWASSETQYFLARGTLQRVGKLPKKRTNDVTEQHIQSLEPVRYTFKGVFIGKTKSSPVSIPVLVEPKCTAVCCGGDPVHEEGKD